MITVDEDTKRKARKLIVSFGKQYATYTLFGFSDFIDYMDRKREYPREVYIPVFNSLVDDGTISQGTPPIFKFRGGRKEIVGHKKECGYFFTKVE